MSESTNLLASQWAEELDVLQQNPREYWDSEGLPMLNVSYSLEMLEKIQPELCRAEYANSTAVLAEQHPEGFCNASFDSVSCWPPTPYNTTAVIRCFKMLNDIVYDDTRKFNV